MSSFHCSSTADDEDMALVDDSNDASENRFEEDFVPVGMFNNNT